MNLQQMTLARGGIYDDGLEYPVFQFSHESNASNTTTSGLAVAAGGDFYTGFWAEELEGLYLFSNISTDQIFYGDAALLDAGVENAEVKELSLVDANGSPVTLASIVGSNRANLRFGKDIYGNLYVASKTNKKLYRLQGTPELRLEPAIEPIVDDDGDAYFEFTLDRPPNDGSVDYTLMVSTDLSTGFIAADLSDYEIVETFSLANGKERVRYRYLTPVVAGTPRFFQFAWDNAF